MAENTDKVVSKVYETFEYEKFKILPENRGHAQSGGLKEKKLATLQNLVKTGQWIHEVSRVTVNKNFEVINGAHTLEICRRNGFPVRYEIQTNGGFNDVPKRDKIGNIYSINSTNTSWNSGELFNAAVQTKAPLALIIAEVLEDFDNYFLWTDVMALLEKNSGYFMGRWRQSSSMKTFERKDLVEQIKSEEFLWELKHFAKFNLKARIAFRKGIILKGAYDILWTCRDMVDPKLFRRSLAIMPEALITSNKMTTEEGVARVLINHYNKSQGQKAETAAVVYALKRPNRKEEVLVIT